jgi:hypothetical protein
LNDLYGFFNFFALTRLEPSILLISTLTNEQ